MSPRERMALVTRVLNQHRRWLIAQELAATRNAAAQAAADRRVLEQRALAAAQASAVQDALTAIDERNITRRALEALLSDVREYRLLQEAATRYGDAYAQAAVDAIEAARVDLIVRAQRVGIATTILQLDETMQGRVAGMLQLVPVENVSRLAGLGANASPLRTLASMGESSSMRVLDAMIDGAARGQSPRRVAQQVASVVTDAADSDVLRVTRSEMLRATRGTTSAWCEANSAFLVGWVWAAELDVATCASCWAMHGTEHEAGDVMGTHPSCRCQQLPRPKSPAELGFDGIPDDRPVVEPGVDRFAALSADERRVVLGPSKAAAYEDGRIGLADVVQVRDDPRWGTTRSVASLDAALANAS